MKIKTSELEGAALDWAVAKAEGIDVVNCELDRLALRYFNPSANWSQCGPLIDRYSILFSRLPMCGSIVACTNNGVYGIADDHKVAACRAIVDSVLGDEVDVPDGLVK